MAQQQSYVQGQRISCEGEFRLKGVPTDPAVVTCTFRAPDGTGTTLAYPSADLTRLDLGVYEASLVAQQAGTYSIRLAGAGVVDAVGEATVNVARSTVL